MLSVDKEWTFFLVGSFREGQAYFSNSKTFIEIHGYSSEWKILPRSPFENQPSVQNYGRVIVSWKGSDNTSCHSFCSLII